jgi:hypothetical protein
MGLGQGRNWASQSRRLGASDICEDMGAREGEAKSQASSTGPAKDDFGDAASNAVVNARTDFDNENSAGHAWACCPEEEQAGARLIGRAIQLQ